MSDGKETSGMEDKAVSTMDDLEGINAAYFGGGTHWNAFAIEKLLTVLINNKIMSLRTMNTVPTIDLEKSDSSIEDTREKEPPDRKSRTSHSHHSPHLHHHHHHYHCQKLAYCKEHSQQRSSSISKVQKWSDDLDIDSSPERVRRHGDDELSRERVKNKRKRQSKETYTVVDIESTSKTRPPKKRKRKKRKRVGSQVRKKKSVTDPDDLPKRARWTIIITSGLLILTCMFLVGVTLRMAPVIDQMVRTKNEELMNSLHRNNNPAYYSSVNPPQN